MIVGYCRQYFGGLYKPEPRGRRRPRFAGDDAGLPWVVGVPLILLITISVGVILWLGWKIDKDLGALARNRQELARATEVNRDLTARRDHLLAPENMSRKAAVLGLFRPTAAQIRKP